MILFLDIQCLKFLISNIQMEILRDCLKSKGLGLREKTGMKYILEGHWKINSI